VRRRAAGAALILLSACALRPLRDLSPGQGQAVSVLSLRDGAYTVEQSRRGEQVFFTTCVRCHKPEMTGSEIVPPLVGEAFLGRWSRKTAGDLFEWVRTKMPPGDAAAGMTGQNYADVLAYVFSRNEFPAGNAELAPDFGALRLIRIVPETIEQDGGDPHAVD